MATVCAAQTDRGHEVWACLPPSSAIESDLVRLGVTVLEPRLKTSLCLLKLGLRVRGMGFDILHSHLTGGTHAANVISLLANVPVVVHGHICSTDYNYKLAAGRGMMIAVSESVARHYNIRCGIPCERITVVRNGSDITRSLGADIDRRSARQNLCAELGLPAETRFLVVAGRLVPLKGQDVLLEAFHGMAEDYPDLHVVLAGPPEDGDYADRLLRFATRHGLGDRVHLLGLRSDVAALLRAADVAVVPSRHEAFPLSVIEPLLLGVPVVASDVGGIGEALPRGVGPSLVPAGDSGALASTLSHVLDGHRQALREAGFAAVAVRERFSVASMVDGIEAVYRNLLPGVAAESVQA